MAVGGSGVICVTSNVLPAEMAQLCRNFLEGDMTGAARLHHRLLPMCDALFVETNPIPVKAALAMMGRIKNELRLPLVPITDQGAEKVRTTLGDFGLI
jgi:4-hydroxy-tetrahydrodipicolinate synthase